MGTDYTNIERPYGSFLEREEAMVIPTADENEVTSVQGGPSGNAATGPEGGATGSVEETQVKSEGALGDLWIDKFIRSSNWKPQKQGFYIDGLTGYAEFSNIYIAGAITVITGGTIGGWTISPTQLSSGNVKIQSSAERMLFGSATAPLTGNGIFIGRDGVDYEFRAGDPAGAYMHWTGTDLNVNAPILFTPLLSNALATGSILNVQGWQFSGTFSVTDADTVAWSSGDLTFADGQSFSINSGNTGNMAAKTYIYFDKGVSITAFQTTTSASGPVGANRVLIAVAKNGTGEATYMVMNASDTNIDASSIVANSITANELAATIVYAGALVIDTGGHIRSGQTAYDTGTGWFLGRSGGTSKFSVGNSSGPKITWDGTTFEISGAFRIGNSITVTSSDNIQDAITELASTGGTVYLSAGTWTLFSDILMSDGVSLIGSGIDVTILDFAGNNKSLKATNIDSFTLAGMTVQGSANTTAAVNISGCTNFDVNNVKSADNDGVGLLFTNSTNFSCSDSIAYFNLGSSSCHGFKYTNSAGSNTNVTFTNCIAQRNGGHGFFIESSTSSDDGPFVMDTCFATENTLDGFQINATTGTSTFNPLIMNCTSYLNIDTGGVLGAPGSGTGKGFDSNMSGTTFIKCRARSNGGDGFEITDTSNKMIACDNEDPWDVTVRPENFIANTDNGSLASISETVSGTYAVVTNPKETDKRELVYMTNTSGGTLNAGDVVVMKAAAAGSEITTTTTAGDDKVYGMVFDASIANNAAGRVLIRGKTTQLKVDGTTDIAIGDYLTTFTTAKIAAKAAAGDMCFAMALEAYTTNDSNGVIDALLFTPRLI